MSKRQITVLGNGGWGTAIALVLLENGHRVTIWGHDPIFTQRMARERENSKFLPGIALPAELEMTSAPEAAGHAAELVVSVVPTRFLRSVVQGFKGHLAPKIPIVSLTKGIERETFKRPTQIVHELLPGHPLAVLSGPSHAEEVARRIPTSVVVSANSKDLAQDLQQVFSTERFRVYTNADPVGVELAGALKNIIAIAAGVCDGLGFGDNTKAALVTRGLAEMVRLATKLGARKLTFTGLAGIGDLITTSFSDHGRNRAVGQKLGLGTPLERIIRETEMVAEGVTTTEAVVALARDLQVDMPITSEVHQMLSAQKDPARSLEALMNRSSRGEEWD